MINIESICESCRKKDGCQTYEQVRKTKELYFVEGCDRFIKEEGDDRWCNTCEFKHLESECLGCAEYDEYDNLIDLRNYKKEETDEGLCD